jgi:hypothetical protein
MGFSARCESGGGCYIGASGDSLAAGQQPPARPRQAASGSRCLHKQSKTTQLRAYLGLPKLGPLSKGGDPVSHCQSPRSPASVSWILASKGVHVA